MLVTISLLVGFVSLVYFYLTWNFQYWKNRNVPGPKPTILLGNLPKNVPGPKPTILLGNLPNVIWQKKNMAHDLVDLYKKYRSENFIGIFMIRAPVLLIIDSELVKDVFIRNFKNFNSNGFEEFSSEGTILSNNPFFISGERWKVKRGEISPAFTAARLKPIIPLIEDVSQNMLAYIKKQNPNKQQGFNGRDLCARFTVDVVSSSIFGVDGRSFLEEKPLIKVMGQELLAQSFSAVMYMQILSIIPYFLNFFKLSLVTEKTQTFFIKLMNDAMQYREDNNIERDDYMNYLIKLKKQSGLSEMDVTCHGISFFIDGFDTSSVVMSLVLYELGKHVKIQEKLRNEIKTSYECSYLDQVIHESLRLHPVITPMVKVCSEPIEVSKANGDKFVIEKGTTLHIPVYAIHRDPQYYADPDTFNPERFDPENGGIKAFKEKGVFLAFGDGPRMCLGMKMALLQMKIGIAKIVSNFEISVNSKTIEPLELDPKELLLTPTGGVWLNFKPI